MFAVAYWNDYTNYKLYITKELLYNFQMKLRSIMMGSDLPQANNGRWRTPCRTPRSSWRLSRS
jgi:putative aldouronate transport system permease protein